MKRIRLFSLGILALFSISCQESGPQQLPTLEIPVVKVINEHVPLTKEYVASITGYFDIPIRARVDGYLEGRHFQEGTFVKEGQLLYTIDPQPFEAEVARVQSELAQAKIASVNASNELQRYEPLVKINAVSKSDYDAAVANDGAAKAAVEAAEASLRIARINLGYTRIKSPITGIIGKTKARRGEYVGRDPNPVILNTVSRTDSIYAEFFLPEGDYLWLSRTAIERGIDYKQRTGDRRTNMELILSDGSVFKYKGFFNFIDRQVDPTTGSILVQAIFPNPEGLLRPGIFGKVRIQIEEVPNGTIIPQRAVREFQGIRNVFVVNSDSTVSEKQVQLGATYNDFWVVESGLEGNETIVLEVQRVREGVKIKPVLQEFVSQFEEE